MAASQLHYLQNLHFTTVTMAREEINVTMVGNDDNSTFRKNSEDCRSDLKTHLLFTFITIILPQEQNLKHINAIITCKRTQRIINIR